jgi:hypothetical protein
LTLLVLVAAGALFVAANVWFAGLRSTIPLNLDATVLHKEVRHEKHPPHDDVCLITLDSQRVLQVDQAIYDAIRPNDYLRKDAGSRHLTVSGRTIELNWSRDAKGIAYAMPISLLVIVITAAIVGLASWDSRLVTALL